MVYVATGNAAISALRSFYTQVIEGGGSKEFHKICPRVLPVEEEGVDGRKRYGMGKKRKQTIY